MSRHGQAAFALGGGKPLVVRVHPGKSAQAAPCELERYAVQHGLVGEELYRRIRSEVFLQQGKAAALRGNGVHRRQSQRKIMREIPEKNALEFPHADRVAEKARTQWLAREFQEERARHVAAALPIHLEQAVAAVAARRALRQHTHGASGCRTACRIYPVLRQQAIQEGGLFHCGCAHRQRGGMPVEGGIEQQPAAAAKKGGDGGDSGHARYSLFQF